MTRIIFNGQEFGGVEAMPPDVRQAYQEAVGSFEDANRNGIPDILEQAGGNVIKLEQSSITVNGRAYRGVEEMPVVVRRFFEEAMGQLESNRSDPSSAALGLESHRARVSSEFDKVQGWLAGFLKALLGIAAVGVFLIAIAMMWSMGPGARNQGGRIYVAVGALVVLGFIDTQFDRLARRQASFIFFESDEYRRSRLCGFLVLAIPGVLLLAFAFLWP